MKTTYYCLDSHYNTVLQLFCYGGTNLTGLSDAGTKHLVATQKQCVRRKGELAELIVNMTVTKDENYLDYEKYFIFPG